MLFRALFWIAVVSVFMPREPDLGFGRQDSRTSLLETAGGLASALQSNPSCSTDAAACRSDWGLLDSLQSITIRNLAQVKADIEEAERARGREDFDTR